MSVAHAARRPLSREAMRQALEQMVSGQMAAEEIRQLLSTVAARGETSDEIAGAVEGLRRHAVTLPLAMGIDLCDTCGTGGDQQQTVNVSTLAALVAASCGVRIAKHGNRAASSRCGSADLLEALGVNLEAAPTRVAESIERLGFGFCFAPRFHPAMKAVAPIRKALGIRTIFNVIGPLANPAPLAYQLVGVSDQRLMRPVAEALRTLGIAHGLVVHGDDGLDEVTTTGVTEALELRGAEIRAFRLRPEDVGFSRSTIEQLRGGEPAENARLAREILGGAPSPQGDIVALNAGCAIYVADQATTIQEGVAKAQAALDAGVALELLERVAKLSKQP